MALIRGGGRPVLSDITASYSNADVIKTDEAVSATEIAGALGYAGASGCNHARSQKATTHHPASNSAQPYPLQPSASPRSAPLLAMPTSSLAPGPVLPSASGSLVPPAFLVGSGGHGQLRQTHSGKGDVYHWRETAAKTAELAGRLQAAALDSSIMSDYSEALSHSRTRAASSGGARLADSHPNLRSAMAQPGRVSGGHAMQRVSSSVPRSSPGTAAKMESEIVGCHPRRQQDSAVDSW